MLAILDIIFIILQMQYPRLSNTIQPQSLEVDFASQLFDRLVEVNDPQAWKSMLQKNFTFAGMNPAHLVPPTNESVAKFRALYDMGVVLVSVFGARGATFQEEQLSCGLLKMSSNFQFSPETEKYHEVLEKLSVNRAIKQQGSALIFLTHAKQQTFC